MKRITALFISLVFALSICMTAFAAGSEQRVYDYAHLLSEQDRLEVEQEIAAAVEQIGMDYVIVTVDNKGGKSLREFADDFYDEGEFGIGKNRSGVVILIDMEERTVYMSTCGDAINYYNDDRIYNMTDGDDQLYDFLAEGNYRRAMERTIAQAVFYYEMGIDASQYTYDEETGQIVRYKKLTILEIILSLIVAIVPAAIYVTSIKNQYMMKNEKKQAEAFKLAYRVVAAFAFAVATDDLINHQVTRMRIHDDDFTGGSGGGHAGRSTIHMSGGGMSHGGGGGGRHF